MKENTILSTGVTKETFRSVAEREIPSRPPALQQTSCYETCRPRFVPVSTSERYDPGNPSLLSRVLNSSLSGFMNSDIFYHDVTVQRCNVHLNSNEVGAQKVDAKAGSDDIRYHPGSVSLAMI